MLVKAFLTVGSLIAALSFAAPLPAVDQINDAPVPGSMLKRLPAVVEAPVPGSMLKRVPVDLEAPVPRAIFKRLSGQLDV